MSPTGGGAKIRKIRNNNIIMIGNGNAERDK
jgi:hypothetical protein